MTQEKTRSIQQRWNDLQPSKMMQFWSCTGSVAVALVVGFTWGGWVTGGTARDMAETAGDGSRYELASVISRREVPRRSRCTGAAPELKGIDRGRRARGSRAADHGHRRS